MQRTVTTWLFSSLTLIALVSSIGCGDDDPGTTGTDSGADTGTTPDAGMNADCPTEAPDMGAGLMGGCCYRAENGEGSDSIDLRLSSLDIQTPASLSNTVVQMIVRGAFAKETFSWLLSVEGAAADGTVDITTGFGDRNTDDSFSFADGNAPAGDGAATRWDPAKFQGTIENNNITGTFDGEIILPLGGREELVLELPLQGIELNKVQLSERRSCVGSYSKSGGYDVTAGEFTTYVRVEAASKGTIEVLGNISLCNFVGDIQSTSNCEEVSRAMWDNPPDAICDQAGCRVNTDAETVCDPQDDCNAWVMRANFAGHGVEVNANGPQPTPDASVDAAAGDAAAGDAGVDAAADAG